MFVCSLTSPLKHHHFPRLAKFVSGISTTNPRESFCMTKSSFDQKNFKNVMRLFVNNFYVKKRQKRASFFCPAASFSIASKINFCIHCSNTVSLTVKQLIYPRHDDDEEEAWIKSFLSQCPVQENETKRQQQARQSPVLLCNAALSPYQVLCLYIGFLLSFSRLIQKAQKN